MAGSVCEAVITASAMLRRSVGGGAAETKAAKAAKKPRKAATGQKELLMPIAGKKQAKAMAANKPTGRQQRKSARL
jgi:DNA end-binding protein Ku